MDFVMDHFADDRVVFGVDYPLCEGAEAVHRGVSRCGVREESVPRQRGEDVQPGLIERRAAPVTRRVRSRGRGLYDCVDADRCVVLGSIEL